MKLKKFLQAHKGLAFLCILAVALLLFFRPHPIGKTINAKDIALPTYREYFGDERTSYNVDGINKETLAEYLLQCKKRHSLDFISNVGGQYPPIFYDMPFFADGKLYNLTIMEEEIYVIGPGRMKQYIVAPETAREDLIAIFETGTKKEIEYDHSNASPSDLVQ